MKKFVATLLSLALTCAPLGQLSLTAFAADADTLFVPDEVVAMVETLEEAEALALAYNMEMKSFGYGIAVYTQPNPADVVAAIQSVDDATLPTLYPNRIYTLFEEETQQVAATYTQYQHEALNNDDAWKISTGEGVTVAVIDTGVDYDHSQLSGAVLTSSYNSYTQTVGLDAIDDDHGHGTRVAGIIAAATAGSETTGITGVAPDADLLIIKADRPSDNNFEMSSLIRAINYAVENGADVINMSLGSHYDYGNYEPEEVAIQNAVDAGVVVVCAAGNDSDDNASYPAALDCTIAVTAVRSDFSFANTYSSYGPQIDVSAPGSIIYSTYLNNSYSYTSGTSMATPMVSAIAALLVSVDQDITPDEIRETLTGTARDGGDLGWDQYYGYGVVNSYAALLGADALPTVTYDLNYTGVEHVTTKAVPGETLLVPNDPAYDGSTFLGWTVEETGGEAFDFTTPITEDTSIYAQWEHAPQATPDAPALADKTASSITLTAVDGAEYAISTVNEAPETWQDSPVFEGLVEGTTYYCFVRLAETPEAGGSESSDALTVITSDEILTVTYGDILDFAAVIPDGVEGDVVVFTQGETILTTASILADGVNATYDTSDKALSIGSNAVTVYHTAMSTGVTSQLDVWMVAMEPKALELEWVTAIADQTVTGSTITPTVTLDGLTLDTDYTVAYGENTEIGTGTVAITGMGYYTDTVETTFNIVAKTTSSGSSGSSGSSSSSSSDTTTVDVTTEDGTTFATVDSETTTSGTTTTISVDSDDLTEAIEAVLEEADGTLSMVEITAEVDDDTESMQVELPNDSLSALLELDGLMVTSDLGNVTLSATTLSALVAQAGDSDLILVLELVESDDALVYDIYFLADGQRLTDLNGGTLTIQLPYELGELDAGGIVVWLLDEDGNETLMDATYDSETGCVVFTAEELTTYCVDYAPLRVLYGVLPFTDVMYDDYFYGPVAWAVEQGITTGISETLFAPNNNATRGQTMTLIWKAMGSPAPSSTDHLFTDLDESSYYYDAVLWAVEQGITSGTSDTTFAPEETATRGQIVTFLYRLAQASPVNMINPFADVVADDYCYEAVLWAVGEEITQGVSDTTFTPENLCTRGQIVTFLYRYFN